MMPCRHSSSGDCGVLLSDNVFAAIDPTFQRQLASGTGGSSTEVHQEQSPVQPVIPADIHAARRRAPLGKLVCC